MVYLADLNCCRLCAVETEDGLPIFEESEDKASLAILINKYLPINVINDGKFPVQICVSCHVGVAATVDLIDRMVEGQLKLRAIYECSDKGQIISNVERKEPFAPVLINLQGERDDVPMEDLTKGSSITKVYSEDHPLYASPDGKILIPKPDKKKRGRPRKSQQQQSQLLESRTKVVEAGSMEADSTKDSPRRSRRKAGPPSRYRDSVAGTEFDKLLRDSGIEEDPSSGDEYISEGPLDPRVNQDGNVGSSEMGIFIESSGLELATDPPIRVKIEVDFPKEILGTGSENGILDEGGTPVASVSSVEISSTDYSKVNSVESPEFPARVMKKKLRFSCEICGKSFITKWHFIVHMNSHKGSLLQCGTCKEVFVHASDFDCHQMETTHSGITKLVAKKPFSDWSKCYLCPASNFTSKKEYLVHLHGAHNGLTVARGLPKLHRRKAAKPKSKAYHCGLCGRVFYHPSSYIYHRDSAHNNGKRYTCTVCNASFRHIQLLQKHSTVHSTARPYRCMYCDFAFKTRGNMYNHINIHTGHKKYKCNVCGKEFRHLTAISLHKRFHTGEKPYKCHYCNKSFSQNGNLQEHIRIHTGEKPFACEACGKKFTTSSQLKVHSRQHTEGRQFVCSHCKKAFTSKTSLSNHEKKHNAPQLTCSFCGQVFSDRESLHLHSHVHSKVIPGKKVQEDSVLVKQNKLSGLKTQPRTSKESLLLDREAVGDQIFFILPEKESHSTAIFHQDADNHGNTTMIDGLVQNSPSLIEIPVESDDQNFPFTLSAGSPSVIIPQPSDVDSDKHYKIFNSSEGQDIAVISMDDSATSLIAENVESREMLEMTFKDASWDLCIPGGEEATPYLHKSCQLQPAEQR